MTDPNLLTPENIRRAKDCIKATLHVNQPTEGATDALYVALAALEAYGRRTDRDLLRRLEWCGYKYEAIPYCPLCGGFRPDCGYTDYDKPMGHAPGCALAAALAAPKPRADRDLLLAFLAWNVNQPGCDDLAMPSAVDVDAFLTAEGE
jgi:hypothetical protein